MTQHLQWPPLQCQLSGIQHVFGFEGLGRVTLSRRLVGLSEILFAQKAALRQARVLSVSDVRMLHKVLDNSGRDAFDRAAAGFVLLGIYGRCRHSDMSNIDHIVPLMIQMDTLSCSPESTNRPGEQFASRCFYPFLSRWSVYKALTGFPLWIQCFRNADYL